MIKNVNDAFAYFMGNFVDLDKQVVKNAREDLSELLQKLEECSGKDFFVLYPDVNLHFGSFSRKTKCQPLNDIDVLVGISAEGNTYNESSWDYITINPSETSKKQQECKNQWGKLDSNKVLGLFKSKLKEICDLRVNEVIKNGEAISVQFKSKTNDLNFDVVPCFFTKPQQDGRAYYLISNRQGNWKKTDPRIDQKRVSAIVQKFGTIVLSSIRLFKYWNKYAKMVTLDGYVMESLLLDYYEKVDKVSTFVDLNFIYLLEHVYTNIEKSIADPKGIEGDINNLTWQERTNVKEKVKAVYNKAREANAAERENNNQKAINIWRDIFGEDFPQYES